jgi:hypothetical protein
MPALSRAANYSRLWMGIAAALAASEGKWGRRAALRGLASIAIASTATNVVGKRLTGRLRPASEIPLPRREAPAAPTGEGLALVMNSTAGTTSDELSALLRQELPDARIMIADEGDELTELIAEAASGARILGIAGGDGSVQLAAGLAADKGLPLLVIPAGTFNHFATDLGVRSAQDALAALRAGDSVLVDVAMVGERSFLNTASMGVYVDLVRAREELEERLGKWPAILVALVRVLGSSRPQDLVVNGRRRRLWLLFAGNCRYEPAGAAPPRARTGTSWPGWRSPPSARASSRPPGRC